MENQVKFCTSCGGELQTDEKFCPHCGKPVTGKVSTPAKESAVEENTFFSKIKEIVLHNKIASGAILIIVLIALVWMLFFNTPFNAVAGSWQADSMEGMSGTVDIKRDGLMTMTFSEQMSGVDMSVVLEGQLQEGVQDDVFRTGYLTPVAMNVAKNAYTENYEEFAEIAYEAGVPFEEDGDLMVLDLTKSPLISQELSQEMGILSVYSIGNEELVISDQYGEDPISFYK